MTKTILLLTTLAALTTPALAGDRQPSHSPTRAPAAAKHKAIAKAETAPASAATTEASAPAEATTAVELDVPPPAMLAPDTSMVDAHRPAPARSAAAAATSAKPRGDALRELDYGSSFGLKTRSTAAPTLDAETFEARPVTSSQVVQVIHDRVEELEYCWLRVPAKQRVPSSAMMHFAIEASGAVAGLTIEGTLPKGVEACLTKVASKWSFPAADSGCEVEHALALGMKSDTVR